MRTRKSRDSSPAGEKRARLNVLNSALFKSGMTRQVSPADAISSSMALADWLAAARSRRLVQATPSRQKTGKSRPHEGEEASAIPSESMAANRSSL